MKAYQNEPAMKAALLEGIAWHRAADLLRAGSCHTEDGHVCVVGCNVTALRAYAPARFGALSYDDHAGLAEALGVPEALVRLQGSIFGRIPVSDRLDWPARWAEAIQPGGDYSRAHHLFLDRLLTRRVDAGQDHDGVVSQVRDLHRFAATGARVTCDEWLEAAWAAEAEATAMAAEAADAAMAAEAAAEAASWGDAAWTGKAWALEAAEMAAARAAADAAGWALAAEMGESWAAEAAGMAAAVAARAVEARAQADDLIAALAHS